jgi:hypothetical protein
MLTRFIGRDGVTLAKADHIQEGWNGTKSARAPNSDLVAGGAFCRADVRV